jgi:hypothetical protein
MHRDKLYPCCIYGASRNIWKPVQEAEIYILHAVGIDPLERRSTFCMLWALILSVLCLTPSLLRFMTSGGKQTRN